METLIKNGEERRESISIKYYRCKLPKGLNLSSELLESNRCRFYISKSSPLKSLAINRMVPNVSDAIFSSSNKNVGAVLINVRWRKFSKLPFFWTCHSGINLKSRRRRNHSDCLISLFSVITWSLETDTHVRHKQAEKWERDLPFSSIQFFSVEIESEIV